MASLITVSLEYPGQSGAWPFFIKKQSGFLYMLQNLHLKILDYNCPSLGTMGQFELFFGLGKDHILDFRNGYDHILFIVALCAVYIMRDWRKILILVTAFTIGHSITLALATLNIIRVKNDLIEFLISVTIFITAVFNLFRSEDNIHKKTIHLNYFFASGFGLIHGMGFSNYLREILGKTEHIASPLLAFNLGLEFGQIIIVGIFMAIGFILVDLMGIPRRDWKMVISSAIAGIAFILIKESAYLSH